MKQEGKPKSPLELKSGKSSLKAFLNKKDGDKLKGLKSKYQPKTMFE